MPGNPSPPTSPPRPAARSLIIQESAVARLRHDAPVTSAVMVAVADDDPRRDGPAAAGVKIIEVAGRRAAIGWVALRALPGDVAAAPGTGHERGQEVDGEVLPFDDRVEPAGMLRKVAAG